MGLLIKGISRLSELAIDADKDWQGKGIASLKQLATAMAKGDLVVRGDSVLLRLQPGPLGHVLTSAGPLHLPAWAPPGGELKFYFPVSIDLSHARSLVSPAGDVARGAPISSDLVQGYADDAANYLRRLGPALAVSDAEAIIAAAQSASKTPPLGSQGGLQMLVESAMAHLNGGADSDETTAARNATASDMTLMRAAPQVDDAYYFGFPYPADRLWLNVGQAGVGNWANAEEYWNGAWAALPGVADLTNQFMAAGLNYTAWTRPGDWTPSVINGRSLYWMRYRLSAFVNMTAQPKGTQAWYEIFV